MEPVVYIWGERLAQVNVIVHLLTGLVLIGAVTHHLWLVVRGRGITHAKAIRRFSFWAAVSYLTCFAWGCFIYPAYRYYVRFLVQDERAPWATGLFEIKEHWLALGLALLPFYLVTSRSVKDLDKRERWFHYAAVVAMAVVVWYSFVLGAVVVDLRGELYR